MLKKITHVASHRDAIWKLIEDCRNESIKDKRIERLNQINSVLLRSDQFIIPSEITSEDINQVLHKVEAKLLLLSGSK